MKKILAGLCAAIVVLIVIVSVNTFRKGSLQLRDVPPAIVSVDAGNAAAHLADAIKFKTVSEQEGTAIDRNEFLRLHEYLARTYPRLHRALQREKVNELSLLYTWKGSDPSLKPMLLMAHLDVVPADPSTLDTWTHPPFGGAIADGFVWGRGALDIKCCVIAIMEAVEYLVGIGYAPRRTVYLAFGHDEELSGEAGSAMISRLLESRGVALDFVLDEGGSIVDGILTMVSLPVALIGIAEKGYLTLELSVSEEGGHSSMPARETNVDIVCAAVTRLVARQFPSSIAGVIGSMMEYLAPEAPFGTRLVMSNLWLFSPLARWQMSGDPGIAASLHTTIAPTMMSGSNKENVLPAKATAIVNFRILPGDTSKDVIGHVKDAIDDPRVKIRVVGTIDEPSGISPMDSPLFTKLHATIRQVCPKVIVTPYLVLGATDSRHYLKICRNVFRFTPYTLKKEDLKREHGLNERIAVEDMKKMVGFYAQLVKNLNE